MCEKCEMTNNTTEIVFTLPREDLEYFKQKMKEWKMLVLKNKQDKEKKELLKKIKSFQKNCNIATFKEAKKLYLEQCQKIENVVNERI